MDVDRACQFKEVHEVLKRRPTNGPKGYYTAPRQKSQSQKAIPNKYHQNLIF